MLDAVLLPSASVPQQEFVRLSSSYLAHKIVLPVNMFSNIFGNKLLMALLHEPKLLPALTTGKQNLSRKLLDDWTPHVSAINRLGDKMMWSNMLFDLTIRGIPHAVHWPCAPLEVAPVLHLVAFDATVFQQEHFGLAGIECPRYIGSAVRKRQAEYYHGRLCARAALKSLGRDSTVGTGTMREPVWPPSIVGSITHGGALAAAVALPSIVCQGIGIDIEQVPITAEAQYALRSKCVSVREYSLLESLKNRIDIGILLTLVFSAKESFFKATFPKVGYYFDFDVIEVRAIDLERNEMTFSVIAPPCAEWHVGAHLCIQYSLSPSGYLAALFAW